MECIRFKALFVVAATMMAGCIGETNKENIGGDGSSVNLAPRGPVASGSGDEVGSTWFVLLEESFTVSKGERMQGAFGPTCPEASYDPNAHPATLALHGLGGPVTPPFLVLLRKYDSESLAQEGVDAGDSSGLVRYDAASGEVIAVASPFDNQEILVELVADEFGVRLEGALFDDQQEMTITDERTVDGPDGLRTITTILHFRNLGRINPMSAEQTC